LDQIISFKDSGFYSKLMLDYLGAAEQLKPFYQYSHDEAGIRQALASRTFDAEKRAVLKDALLKQYQLGGIELGADNLVRQHIDALGNTNTYTITTGHQLCLLSGPLYVILKIAHAIKLAQTLSTKQKPVVPVFWMATEDHDIEEIKTVVIKGHSYTWNTDAVGVAVGTLHNSGIGSLIEQIAVDIPELKDALTSLIPIYSQSENLADATRLWAHHWFADYGLVVIDAHSKEFKRQFVPIIKQDVLHQLGKRMLGQSSAQLEQLGYSIQVKGRPINHFYFDGNKRILIEHKSGRFELQDGSRQWTNAEIEHEIDLYPERFSPNVVFRPLYQESILPNIAYVGGPGELSYWLQLKSLFQETRIPFPCLVARASFVFPDTATIRTIKKLQLTWADIFDQQPQSRNKLLNKWEPTNEKELYPYLIDAYQKLIDESMQIDNKIASSVIEHLQIEKQFFKKITQQLSKAKRHKFEQELKQLDRVVANILPSGVPQERFENLLTFTNNPHAFIQILMHHIQPVSSGVKVLTV
jgi:bacillithiol biosynthesis cysteine-adding enzyme BshC